MYALRLYLTVGTSVFVCFFRNNFSISHYLEIIGLLILYLTSDLFSFKIFFQMASPSASTIVCVQNELCHLKEPQKVFKPLSHAKTFRDVLVEFNLSDDCTCVQRIYCAQSINPSSSNDLIEVNPDMLLGDIIPIFNIKYLKFGCIIPKEPENLPDTEKSAFDVLMGAREEKTVPKKKSSRSD